MPEVVGVRAAVRRRSLRGYVFLGLFWIWSIGLPLAFANTLWQVATGRGVLAGADSTRLLWIIVWVIGAAVLGLLAWLTGGRKAYVDGQEVRSPAAPLT